MSVCEECGSVECYCVGYKRERAARLAAEARAEKEKWRAEVAEAKSAVYGGEWCLSNRAAGRNRCGACAVCFAEEQARAQAAEALAASRYDCHGGPGTTTTACGACVTCVQRRAQAAEEARDYFKASYARKLDDEKKALETAGEALRVRQSAEEEAARLTTELETVRSHRNTILNYWWPRLGFSCANAMAYGPLGDPRAAAQSPLEEEAARLRDSLRMAARDTERPPVNHACAQCVKDPVVWPGHKPGFVCWFHHGAALAATKGGAT